MIKNGAYMSQVVNFDNLQFGNRIPTDVDGLLDLGGKAWVVFEMKRCGAKMPFGQELALRRLVDDLGGARLAIGFVVEHDCDYPDMIDAGRGVVVRYRWKGEWYETGGVVTLRSAIEGFIGRHGII